LRKDVSKVDTLEDTVTYLQPL